MFDEAVRDGMPVAERPTSQGSGYIVFMGDVIRRLAKQELQAAGHETEGHYPRFAALAA